MSEATTADAAATRGTLQAQRWIVALLLAMALLLPMLNAWMYTSRVSIPVITADAWYFMDVFVAKDLDGTLGWTDFFVKRDSSDHAQPLHKLALLLNTHWFGMDFTIEGLIGVLGLLACVVLLLVWAIRQRSAGPLRFGDACVLALLPLLLASLNSREIYAWSLVTLFYIALPFALLSFVIASRLRPLALFGCALLSLLALDGAGVLACVALLVTLLIEGLRGASWRSVLRCIAALLLAVLLYKAASAWLLPPVPTAPAMSLDALWQTFRAAGSEPWMWALHPASASVAHLDHLVELFAEDAAVAQMLIGVAVIALHALFWWSALRSARSRLGFVAIALMLLVYGMTAGIIISRVPQYGTGYLLQHRYVAFYQLANIALLLQWLVVRRAAHDRQPSDTEPFRYWLLPATTLIAVASWQIHLWSTAWAHSVYIAQYGRNMAQAVFCLGAHPEIAEKPVCVANLSVCGWNASARNRLVGLLREHQLNVYSPTFQQRHAMAPDPERMGMCVPGMEQQAQ